jgi:hypothetical protein
MRGGNGCAHYHTFKVSKHYFEAQELSTEFYLQLNDKGKFKIDRVWICAVWMRSRSE